MRTKLYLLFGWLLSVPLSGHAQSKLYLDLRAGINNTFAEGAYFGKGKPPFKAYDQLNFDVQGVAMLRLQLTEKLGLAAGYSGSTLGWAYSIRLPEQPGTSFYGAYSSRGSGVYMHQLPLLVSKTIGTYNIREIDTVRHLYLASFRLDAVLGGGLNRIGDDRVGRSGQSTSGLSQDIDFQETVILRRKWGQFLMGGVTARFYRLGKERANLSLYYTQGLTNMLLVPVEYQYNSQRGATTLHVRGSGLSATLGLPLRLATFGREPALPKERRKAG